MFLGTGDAEFDPLTRRLGNGIVGVKLDANKQLQLTDFFGAPNANWLWRRDLDVNTTPVVDRLPQAEVPGRHEQGMPAVAAGSRRARRRGSPDDAAYDAADLQRRAGVRCQGHLGRTERVAGREGHAVGARAVLGTGQHDVQGANRARTADRRRRGGVQARRARRQVAAHARLALARHGSGGGGGDRERRGLRLCGRRGCVAGDAGPRVGREGWPRLRRRAQLGPGAPGADSRRAALYALDAQTGKELWSSGNQIESWNHFSGLTVANGRAYVATFDGDALLLRRRQVGGGSSCAVNV